MQQLVDQLMKYFFVTKQLCLCVAQLADYKKKLDEAVQSADGYEEAKKKTAYELDARQQAIDALTSDNDKLNKSKKKIQSEVIKLSGNIFRLLDYFCCPLFLPILWRFV